MRPYCAGAFCLEMARFGSKGAGTPQPFVRLLLPLPTLSEAAAAACGQPGGPCCSPRSDFARFTDRQCRAAGNGCLLDAQGLDTICSPRTPPPDHEQLRVPPCRS